MKLFGTKPFIKGYRGEVRALAEAATAIQKVQKEHDVISFGTPNRNECHLTKKKFLELFKNYKDLKIRYFTTHIQLTVVVNQTEFVCLVYPKDPEFKEYWEAKDEHNSSVQTSL